MRSSFEVVGNQLSGSAIRYQASGIRYQVPRRRNRLPHPESIPRSIGPYAWHPSGRRLSEWLLANPSRPVYLFLIHATSSWPPTEREPPRAGEVVGEEREVARPNSPRHPVPASWASNLCAPIVESPSTPARATATTDVNTKSAWSPDGKWQDSRLAEKSTSGLRSRVWRPGVERARDFSPTPGDGRSASPMALTMTAPRRTA